MGQTRDDAAGEAFDKVSKMLGLGYPGGKIISDMAAQGDPKKVIFKRPYLDKTQYDFSFSGIKTAVLQYVEKCPKPFTDEFLADLSASFQAAMVEVLTLKTLRAAKEEGLERIVVAGGVACNSGLRQRFQKLADEKGLTVRFPSPALCGDNAAMIGAAAAARVQAGVEPSVDVYTNLPIDDDRVVFA